MSRILTRALLIACLVVSAPVFADDEDNNTPLIPLQIDEPEDVEEIAPEEPGRLQEGAEYYDGAETVPSVQPQANLFYNYYATPGMPAAMYPAPYPTPVNIGHVYYTYQPFLPHEFLYPHARVYHTYHGNYHGYHHLHGGSTINRTTVRWQTGHGMRPWYPMHHKPPCVPGIPVQAHH